MLQAVSPRFRGATQLVLLIACTSYSIAPTPIDAAEPDGWRVADPAELESQRNLIRTAANQVDRLLNSASEGEQWRSYLLWDSLHAAIAKEVDEDTVRQLDAMSDLWGVYNRLTDDYPGLERREFQTLRLAIRPRLRQLNAILTRRGEAESSARRERLRELAAAGNWTGEAQSEYAQHLRWLDDRLQDLPIDEHFPRADANLLVNVHASFIREATITEVVEPTDVDECIVGTRVIGDGVTRGQGWLSPAPGTQDARLIANFRGVLQSDTVGYNGPVRIYSDGYTQLTGMAHVQLDAQGLRVVGQHVNASATSKTKGVSTRFSGILDRLVTKIAYRQIAKKKGQSDWESSVKARRSFQAEFADDVSQQISDGNSEFQNLLRLPLQRRDLVPQRWDWSSRSSGLTTALQFDGRQRISPSKPQTPIGGPGALQASIHQSFLDNAAEGYLAGRLFSLDELIPAELDQDATDLKDVAIRLDDFQPLRCVFDHNEVSLHLLGRQFVAGGSEYPAAVIVIKYRFESTPEGIKLVRAEDPQVVATPRFSRPPKFGIGGTALRAAIEPVLKESLPSSTELTIPEIDPEAPEVVKQLKVVAATTHNGWLQIVLDRPLADQ